MSTLLKSQSFAGLLLIFSASLAVICRNSFLGEQYQSFFNTIIGFDLAGAHLKEPVVLWINDALMAIFFLLVGLEIKRELLEGVLSDRRRAALPVVAAAGGMIVPALFFLLFNFKDSYALRGWAVPVATDIAFALGILALAGRHVPVALKVFLTALAIIDDLGAILIIAFFYTEQLSVAALLAALVPLLLLFFLNRQGNERLWVYILLGLGLWFCVFQSGIHATLAGVALAFAVPIRGASGSPLRRLEHLLHPWVTFAILPLFAFANSGLDLASLEISSVADPVVLGIALGLFLGKQLGVFFAGKIVIHLGYAELPRGVTWRQFYGISVLTGIGFTMSLFIGGLAYDKPEFESLLKLGVILGSLLSTMLGYWILRKKPRSFSPSI